MKLIAQIIPIVTFTLITSMAGHAQDKTVRVPLPKKSAALSSSSKATCELLMKSVVVSYKELFTNLSASRKQELRRRKGAINTLLDLPANSCDSPRSMATVLSATTQVLNAHNNKIGLLLADTTDQKSLAYAALSGMRAYTPGDKFNFKKNVIVKDTKDSGPALAQNLAELVLFDRVSLIIGGIDKNEARILAPWGDKLLIPIFVLSSKNNIPGDPRQAFFIFPNPEDLAARLVSVLKYKTVRKVGILQPKKQKPSRIIALLIDALGPAGIKITQNITYNPSENNSLEMAAKQTFQIDQSERSEEFTALVKTAKEKSDRDGTEFHPERVTLPPIIDFDAVIIPDNFRNVRHLVQIFKSLGVKKIMLVGTQEWRAYGLVNPPEPFLNQSIFVDYIGSYQMIPPGINPVMQSAPFFVNPLETSKIDYGIIGNQAIKLASLAIKDPTIKRHKLSKVIEQLQNSDSPFFPLGPAFTPDHRSVWPTFIFEVQGSQISPYFGGGGTTPVVTEPAPASPATASPSIGTAAGALTPSTPTTAGPIPTTANTIQPKSVAPAAKNKSAPDTPSVKSEP